MLFRSYGAPGLPDDTIAITFAGSAGQSFGAFIPRGMTLTLVGDASCVESIAGAHAKAKDAWWRHHLADAFYTIVTRERLTSRHAVMKKIAKRSPGLVASPKADSGQ